MCAKGHVLAWFVEADFVLPEYCAKCGDRVLVACPACGAGFPPDGEMLQWVPYHGNCASCGAPYPWKADDIARAKRALAEQAETEKWPPALAARAGELVDEIASDRATGSAVAAGIGWLVAQGAEGASAALLDAVERLGSASLKQALRPTFPGLF